MEADFMGRSPCEIRSPVTQFYHRPDARDAAVKRDISADDCRA